jgi:hypothetical protein
MIEPLQAGQELLGLIKPGNPAGGSKGGATWDLIFHLAAWRIPQGEVCESRLRCLLPVGDPSHLKAWYPVVPGLGLVRLEVDRHEGQTLWVRQVSVLDGDAELEAIRQALQEPVALGDSELGTLTLDRSLDIYEGEVQWNGRPVYLTLSCDDPQQPLAVLNVAKALIREHATWDTLAREAAVAKLLPLKNNTWLDEGEDPVSPAAFAQRMTLNTLDVSESGRWSLWFGDDDMFWGHAILVSGDVTTKEVDAEITG